ncbi:MAG: AMP-binding protein, partial [Chlamydiae bacterium]|nr:AMP-binding protein [Chlamydiota bacterium]
MFDQNCFLKEAAKTTPHHFAIDSATFLALDRMADDFVLNLSRLGLQAGDRIAVLHKPCVEIAALFFAIWRLGASFCPLSLRIPPAQIETHLNRLDVKLFINAFPLKPIIRKPFFPPLSFPSTLLFTSGSTSTPKIAVLSKSALLWNAKTTAITLNLERNDKWLLNLPLYHVSGLGILLRCIQARAQIVLDEKDPKITHLSMVPTQLYRATPIYPKLKCLLIGGASISTYPEKLPSFVSYGLTEMGSLVATKSHPKPLFGKLPVGFPLPGRKMRLSSDGEIEVRGECLFSGYWHDGKISSPLTPDGWFPTKDIGRMTDEGLLILGRKDFQFISGGENIQP